MFTDDAGEKLPFSDVLTRQVIKVDPFKQGTDLRNFGIHDLGGKVVITFEEDILNQAALALQELFKLPSFTIVVEQLDGNDGVTKTTTFSKTHISEIKHGVLDYAGGGSTTERMALEIPMIEGNKIEALRQDPVVDVLLTLLKGLKISVNKPGKPGTVQPVVTFSFQEVQIT
jgi:hypothetical protein